MKLLLIILLFHVYTATVAQSTPEPAHYARVDTLSPEARKDTLILRQAREIRLLQSGIEQRQTRTAGVWFVAILLTLAGVAQELVR